MKSITILESASDVATVAASLKMKHYESLLMDAVDGRISFANVNDTYEVRGVTPRDLFKYLATKAGFNITFPIGSD